MDEPRSPCISVCALDAEDLCIGCYRSAGEIARWSQLTAKEKQEVLENAATRRGRKHSVRLD
ncbi:DUF1289 domain-containing protein [Gilvimarinus sp. F26214L]|uniref:DUF1289 domain-containing protein n=1 Tax=Gilvimarinus sp. DZF01 TaxID=3461371 RepID=UPI004045B409